jgi:hypothetical protein
MDECKKLDNRHENLYKILFIFYIKQATAYIKHFTPFLLLLPVDFQRMNGYLWLCLVGVETSQMEIK